MAQEERTHQGCLFLPRVVFGMFFPRVFLRLPAFQTSTTAETQHHVSSPCEDTHNLISHKYCLSFEMLLVLSVVHQRSTCAVEASSGKPLWVYRVLHTCKATKPLLKSPPWDSGACILTGAALLLLYTTLEWDVSHIVPKDEEAVGIMFAVFSPCSVPCFPVAQHATTAETLHPVALHYVEEASLGQISGTDRSTRGPGGEGL